MWQILQSVANCSNEKNKSYLMHIYKSQVRGSLEYCSTVWHSSLTQSDCNDIERVQKAAMKVIMGIRYQGYEEALKFMKIDSLGEQYICYKNALKVLNLQSLDERRESLCLGFAKKCLHVKKFKSMFPKKHRIHTMKKRTNEKFLMKRSFTERHRKSAIPYMQRLLNRVEIEKEKICNQIDTFEPVNSRFL